jgi:arylsulfatase A-like enzyme
MPTLAARVGYRPEGDPGWDGQNLWPLLIGETETLPDRPIYTVWGKKREWEALRMGEWKIVRNNLADGEAVWELYNLAEDPYETVDRAEKLPGKLAELRGFFEKEKAKDHL